MGRWPTFPGPGFPECATWVTIARFPWKEMTVVLGTTAGAADRPLWLKLHSADISPWASTCSSAPSRRGLQECGLLAAMYHQTLGLCC